MPAISFARALAVLSLLLAGLAGGGSAVAGPGTTLGTGPGTGPVEAPDAGHEAVDAAPDRVRPRVETPTKHDTEEDGYAAADDPAIWVHPTQPSRSVVLGTLKDGGLDVYDLGGNLVQHIKAPAGPGPGLHASYFNNVDLVQDVTIDGLPNDVAVASDRGRDRLRIYAIDPAGAAAPEGQVLTDVSDPEAPRLFSQTEEAVEKQRSAYGLTLLRTDVGAVRAVASQRNTTRLSLVELAAGADGLVTYVPLDIVRMPAKFRLPDGTTWRPCVEPGELAKFEGMTVDSRTQALYAGQEDVGIWRIQLTADSFGKRTLVEVGIDYGRSLEWDPEAERCVPTGPPRDFGGKHLTYQIEGLTIAYEKRATTLVASSQGDSTFALFRLGGRGHAWTWDGQFEVAGSKRIDDVTNSDGAAVVTASLGPGFAHGLLVVQDGPDTRGGGEQGARAAGSARNGTNFKYVRWRDVRRCSSGDGAAGVAGCPDGTR